MTSINLAGLSARHSLGVVAFSHPRCLQVVHSTASLVHCLGSSSISSRSSDIKYVYEPLEIKNMETPSSPRLYTKSFVAPGMVVKAALHKRFMLRFSVLSRAT